ncbi:BREX-6 system adenine-specific DNA-methyltransferase PglX [Pyxidicoccus fallax]|uniref:site-specific DNA-methyltransferase (adenine-specific) n=1 Tax=Pyxidicoccus fallax TaxID=394095 RepID=A0A848LPC4_9BACT|nr:BREX-6 system adenine-specific DNA-methyltransferase PglX [Pyxidicoccus fallax]NMO19433.1 BREX-6 system adenine-specific DNA-methyltransferase PglX [Pyxidicoccus fallax]NPC81571.1 BREX-6 system adenine-specific DNA-methyltransferase PglX [Pyxidicoccus fallax]
MTSNPSARLTPESKAALRKTIRELREVLREELLAYAKQRYLLDLALPKARLTQAMHERRRRLESALTERAAEEGGTKEARERALDNAIKEAGATLLNRLVLIRHLEAVELSKPPVVTGGWRSRGYQQFREFAPGLIADETQGYGLLLQLLFDELSASLPGLFGDVGLTSLFPPSPSTLRKVIEALDEVPAEAWRDDMTLGWVYQYWNDPDREALDAKLHERGKLEPHEIASKTQMFTERYMVEWLLHNSLGPTWLAMCRKNGWTADVEKHGVLMDLDDRRAEWRKKREAGEVALDALMPINGPLEEAWKYYVPQPLPEEVVKHAPSSIRELKLLDPACGSGHFLVVAFDLLAELYREEARHRGESWSDRQIAEWILENNLHGVDIDPRAVQIAAAAIFLKARTLARDASPRQVNLVAPALRLSALDRKDPALLKLERDIELETGIPPELTRQLMDVLAGVDHLGTLLKVGDAVDRAIEAYQGKLGKPRRQGELFADVGAEKRIDIGKEDAKKIILGRLNAFLMDHAGEEDLGLRLRGQQLTAGLRFASIVREGEYHLVVANPPYQGTSRMKNTGYVSKHYPRGKADLYAAFLERGPELCRAGGASAMVTMRSWMFLSGFTALREHLLHTYDLRVIGDIDRGAFEEVPNEVLATAMSVFRRLPPSLEYSVAIQPTPLGDKSYDRNRTARKRAATLAQVARHDFVVTHLNAVDSKPLLYWWTSERLKKYASAPKLKAVAPAASGLATQDNTRFLRKPWEVAASSLFWSREERHPPPNASWVPYVKGAEGNHWFEPVSFIIRWHRYAVELKVWIDDYKRKIPGQYIKNERHYFQRGIAFTAVGADFAARSHWSPGVFGAMGSSVFPPRQQHAQVLCLLNSADARDTLKSLNPSLHFEVSDVNRLPVAPIVNAELIVSTLSAEFEKAERARETSVEFCAPAPHSWDATQQWAREMIDGNGHAPVQHDSTTQPNPVQHLSFRLGVALGRFDPDGKGIQSKAPPLSLKDGILFCTERSQLGLNSLHGLQDEWRQHASNFDAETLDQWLRDDFFDYHRKLYENRPIYFPLTSTKKAFVAFISIHRWTDSTLSILLAEHLLPEQKSLQGALVDLQEARKSPDRRVRSEAERHYAQHKKWLEELEEFIQKVREVAEKGPPPPDDKTPPREVDAPYRMDLDDGVMVNSAALWPLLEPMWKDPKKWWKELATAKGRKDYDWSHLAARYFPDRVDAKCRKDPSLAVAHGCFWKYHPEKAYQWELRLKDEIDRDFKLEEKDADALRAAFLDQQSARAREIEAAEQARRERKARRQDQEELDLSESEGDEGEDEEAMTE